MEGSKLSQICIDLGCKVVYDRNYARHLKTHSVLPYQSQKIKQIGGRYLCHGHEVPMEFEKLKDLNAHQYLFHRHQHTLYLAGINIHKYQISNSLKSLNIGLRNYLKFKKQLEDHNHATRSVIY